MKLRVQRVEIVRDHPVIARGVTEGLAGQPKPRLRRQLPAALAQLSLDRTVIVRIHDHAYMGMILCGGADHRRATDIDLFHDLRATVASNG